MLIIDTLAQRNSANWNPLRREYNIEITRNGISYYCHLWGLHNGFMFEIISGNYIYFIITVK